MYIRDVYDVLMLSKEAFETAKRYLDSFWILHLSIELSYKQ